MRYRVGTNALPNSQHLYSSAVDRLPAKDLTFLDRIRVPSWTTLSFSVIKTGAIDTADFSDAKPVYKYWKAALVP